MQFVANGPEVPNRLLHLHEDGSVVFFVGAGVSRLGCLPDFGTLASQLYTELNVTRDSIMTRAFRDCLYDRAIMLLERAATGGRVAVRSLVARILGGDPPSPEATATHAALLTLSRDCAGVTRLITTNFDRYFERAILDLEHASLRRFEPPALPVPKSSWSGLVYLHGRISPSPTEHELHQLVLSSGDFGLAYLVERWASRFIADVFRHHTVCFVGYSLEDPVLRYILDALAANTQMGESPVEAFAFAEVSGDLEQSKLEWEAKGVTPILYNSADSHQYLHRTIRTWAETYRDGISGRLGIIEQVARGLPQASTLEDDRNGRLLWALSDPTGRSAEYFARMEPAPSLDWLSVLSEHRLTVADLRHLGAVTESSSAKERTPFSLLERPTRGSGAAVASPVRRQGAETLMDPIMRWLSAWMLRHLDDPRLALWFAERGGHLHGQLEITLRSLLQELDALAAESDPSKLSAHRARSPSAIPDAAMKRICNLALSRRLRFQSTERFAFWGERLRREGLTVELRMELRELLSPAVRITGLATPRELDPIESRPSASKPIELFTWEVCFPAGHIHHSVAALQSNEQWNACLPELLDEFTSLLREVLDLMHCMGDIDDREDLSWIFRPSIAPHEQNRDFQEWTALVDLLRDAWLALLRVDSARARLAAEAWRYVKYPLFRRLSLFAASQGTTIPADTALEWLLADDAWWLWSTVTRREACRLILALTPRLDPDQVTRLRNVIVAGPPATKYTPGLPSEVRTRAEERDVLLRLARLDSAGGVLDESTSRHLAALRGKHTGYAVDNEREEFGHWIYDSGSWRTHIPTPRLPTELADWLGIYATIEHWQDDEWEDRCRDSFCAAASALRKRTRMADWPIERWKAALFIWSDGQYIGDSWRSLASVVLSAPERAFFELAPSLARWIRACAQVVDLEDARFLQLVERLIHLPYSNAGPSEDPVFLAINGPLGNTTEALLAWWFRTEIHDGGGIPPALRPILSTICDPRCSELPDGRVILAGHAVTFCRVDQTWTNTHLLLHFDWNRSLEEALSVWAGFLRPALWNLQFLKTIQNEFFDTVNHYARLEAVGRYGEQYARLLTVVALEHRESFSVEECRSAIVALPTVGKETAAQTLQRGLRSASSDRDDDRRSEYFHNRVVPFITQIWPGEAVYRTEHVSRSFAGICLEVPSSDFAFALDVVRFWLQPLSQTYGLLDNLRSSGLCGTQPSHVVEFLDLITGQVGPFDSESFRAILQQVHEAAPGLSTDSRVRRLSDLV